MIELVFTVCSILHGAQCHTERQTYMAQHVSLFECMRYGQLELARWSVSHPNYSIHKWRCGVVDQTQAKA